MINKQEIIHIANLARIGMSQKELKKIQKDMSSILNYFNLLKKVNVSQVNPTSYSVLVENVMREDEKKERNIDLANKLVEAAPQRKARYIKVKSVF